MKNVPQNATGFQQRVEPLLELAAAYAQAIVHNREDAEDAVQEAAIKGFHSFAAYDHSRPFKAWWFVILRNCCRDLLRRSRTRGPSVEINPSDLVTLPDPAVDQLDEVQWALEQLPDSQRELLTLRYYGDCSYREIAHVLGIPEGTVMSRLHAARKALVEIYKRRLP